MTVPTIAFYRDTSLLTDALVEAYVSAQQLQIDRDYVPVWGGGATCIFVKGGDPIPPDAWQVAFLDHSDMASALGYHDNARVPLAKVFVADDIAAGSSWTVTASHEVIEMLGDPDISGVVSITDAGVTLEYSKELCDCCEDDQFAYWVPDSSGRKHLMTAFATPAWFDPAGIGPFTVPAIPSIVAPFALAEGGYIGVREIAPVAGDWTQRFAQGVPGRRAVGKGAASRTMRRFGGL